MFLDKWCSPHGLFYILVHFFNDKVLETFDSKVNWHKSTSTPTWQQSSNPCTFTGFDRKMTNHYECDKRVEYGNRAGQPNAIRNKTLICIRPKADLIVVICDVSTQCPLIASLFPTLWIISSQVIHGCLTRNKSNCAEIPIILYLLSNQIK